jgi:hypothetical protein
MARLRLHAAKILTLAGLLLAGIGASSALAIAGTPAAGNPPSTVPGSPGDDCSHGNSGKDCRPDPSENGKDCDDHGNARGNEDHCAQAPTTTTDTTTTDTTTTTATTTTSSSTTSTSSSTTTTSTSTSSNATPSSGGSTTQTTSPPVSNTDSGATSTPPSQPELQKELANQVKGVRVTRATATQSNPHELPFTGFPAWALALIGSAMLLTGIGLRKAVS